MAGLIAAIFSLGGVYYLTGTAASSPKFSLLGDQGATVPQIGVLFNVPQLVLQLGLLAVSGAVFLTARVRFSGGRTGFRLLDAVLCCITAVGLCISPQVLPGHLLISDPTPPDVCVGETPQVCYFHEHERYAAPYLTLVKRATVAAMKSGYDALLPNKLVETSRRFSPDEPGTIALDPFETTYPGDEYILQGLVYPDWCAQMSADQPPPSEEFWANQQLLKATWMNVMGLEATEGWIGAEDAARIPLPPDEVRSMMSALRACDFE
jgi:hypothetical protein